MLLDEPTVMNKGIATSEGKQIVRCADDYAGRVCWKKRVPVYNSLQKISLRFGIKHYTLLPKCRIYLKNTQGEYLECNNLYASDAGIECRDDICGLTDSDMPWKDQSESIINTDKQVIETREAVVVEEISRTASGKEAIWLSKKEPLYDEGGNVIGIIGT